MLHSVSLIAMLPSLPCDGEIRVILNLGPAIFIPSRYMEHSPPSRHFLLGPLPAFTGVLHSGWLSLENSGLSRLCR